jgi:hypothetical protein
MPTIDAAAARTWNAAMQHRSVEARRAGKLLVVKL